MLVIIVGLAVAVVVESLSGLMRPVVVVVAAACLWLLHAGDMAC